MFCFLWTAILAYDMDLWCDVEDQRTRCWKYHFSQQNFKVIVSPCLTTPRIISKHVKIPQIFCTWYLWPWLGPSLTMLCIFGFEDDDMFHIMGHKVKRVALIITTRAQQVVKFPTYSLFDLSSYIMKANGARRRSVVSMIALIYLFILMIKWKFKA